MRVIDTLLNHRGDKYEIGTGPPNGWYYMKRPRSTDWHALCEENDYVKYKCQGIECDNHVSESVDFYLDNKYYLVTFYDGLKYSLYYYLDDVHFIRLHDDNIFCVTRSKGLFNLVEIKPEDRSLGDVLKDLTLDELTAYLHTFYWIKYKDFIDVLS